MVLAYLNVVTNPTVLFLRSIIWRRDTCSLYIQGILHANMYQEIWRGRLVWGQEPRKDPGSAGCETRIKHRPTRLQSIEREWQVERWLPIEINRAYIFRCIWILRSFWCIVHFVSGGEGLLDLPFPFKGVGWNSFVKQNCDNLGVCLQVSRFFASEDIPKLYKPFEINPSLFM